MDFEGGDTKFPVLVSLVGDKGGEDMESQEIKSFGEGWKGWDHTYGQAQGTWRQAGSGP